MLFRSCLMRFGNELNLLCQSQCGIRKKYINGRLEVEESQSRHAEFLKPSCMYSEPVVNGKLCPKNVLEVPVRFIPTSCVGCVLAYSSPCGEQGLLNMMKWRESPGVGKALMGPWLKLLWHRNRLAGIRPIGEKKGTKRHLLVDGRGVPLSLVVTGANRHDVTQLELVLEEIIIDRPTDIQQNLCADKGYDGQPALEIIVSHGYIPHVKRRGEEIQEKKCNPTWKARRWVVEVSHSWFNRFRKILVRYEKLSDTYMALLHMAAAIITYRQVGVIYG